MSKPGHRAMPVESVVTRFRSAQQRRRLREMDRSMSRVTELLKSPQNSKGKKTKVPQKTAQKSIQTSPVKKVRDRKRLKKNRADGTEKVDLVEECCPLRLKRNIVLKKVQLKPKHELKVIGVTNKRKRCMPKKGLLQDTHLQTDIDCQLIDSGRSSLSRDTSPRAKRSKRFNQDLSVVDMIQLIEDSGSMDDEDLLEILTCPSPVWWEDPPDGYVEDALYSRPRSISEMYPSIRRQLQENNKDRKRSNTPNILSRKVKDNVKQKLSDIKHETKEDKEMCANNNIDVGITLNNCDAGFIKKRTKLESVLGNLKSKSSKAPKTLVEKVTKTVENPCVSDVKGCVSNKVSVIKNVSSSDVTMDSVKITNDDVKEDRSETPVLAEVDSETTDDDHLTDVSFQDDAFLNELENMDIPIQKTEDSGEELPNVPLTNVREYEKLTVVPILNHGKPVVVIKQSQVVNNDIYNDDHDPVKKAKKSAEKRITRTDSSILCEYLNERDAHLKENPDDSMYSDRKSSMIEDFLEMKLFEEDIDVVNKTQNEISKSEFQSHNAPLINREENSERNSTKSVIKFKKSDNARNKVLKFKNGVPKNLPPLINSDLRQPNVGSMPEHLPPLRRNPGVIQVTSDSPKSDKSLLSMDTSDSGSNMLTQDNVDSISDTNVCFMNEDDEDYEDDKRNYNNNESEGNSVIKCCNYTIKNEYNDSNLIINEDVSEDDLKYSESDSFLTNKSQVMQNSSCESINRFNACDDNDLRTQSLIKNELDPKGLNCKLKCNKLVSVKINDVESIKHEDIGNFNEQYAKTDDLSTFKLDTCDENEFDNHDSGVVTMEKDQSDCIAVYKIVSDDSGNDEPKDGFGKANAEYNRDLESILNVKESNLEQKRDDSIVKSDGGKDKMVFYYKKWKSSCWKDVNQDKFKDKTLTVNNKQLTSDKEEIKGADSHKDEDELDHVECNKVNDCSTIDITKTEAQQIENKKKDIKNDDNDSLNETTDTNASKDKCITLAGTNRIRYCMKCSSIFDTDQCNYCFRKNGAEKNELAADYSVLRIEEYFVCDVCKYKAFSKNSLQRHISSHCCDSQIR